MMAQPAIALGLPLRLLAEGEGVSAAQVIPDHVVGDYTDLETLRKVTDGCAVVTFDHEHVPTEHLHALEDGGIAVRPGPEALVHAQDKGVMRARLAELGVPCPRNALVHSVDDVAAFGLPVRAEDDARRLRRQGRVVRPVGSTTSTSRSGPPRGRRAPARRGARRLPPRAVGPGGPLAQRPGRGVPRRRLDPARRHLQRGRRPGARPRPRARRAGAGDRAADRRRARRHRHPRRRALRDQRRPGAGQRAGDAPAQHRALEPGRRGDLAVREPPARGDGPAARLAGAAGARGR